MQIDFHHAVTYVVARYAGFEHSEASTIAHAAQYVDDSPTSAFLRFDNGMRYQRVATAHPMTDIDNLNNDENSLSWLPFHFLPGNNLQLSGQATDDDYIQKLVCRPDSHVAKAMMAAAFNSINTPHKWHRLGIAAHVFVDTFAHQGFAGLKSDINQASDICDKAGNELLNPPVPPVGHGQVATHPDKPFLRWSYIDWQGNRIERDNPTDFTQAAHRLCQEFQRFRLGDPNALVPGLNDEQRNTLTELFERVRHEDGEERHKEWLDAIANDHFGSWAVTLKYEGKDEGSWKHLALGDVYLEWRRKSLERAKQEHNLLDSFKIWSGKSHSLANKIEALADKLGADIPVEYKFSQEFLSSDYKKFHDAARAQRHEMFGVILPGFGIHAA